MKEAPWWFLSGFIAGTINYWLQSRYGRQIDSAAIRTRQWLTRALGDDK